MRREIVSFESVYLKDELIQVFSDQRPDSSEFLGKITLVYGMNSRND